MKKKKFRILLGFLGLVLMCFVYTAISIRFYSKRYFEKESDVAVVLGAGTSHGKLSPVYEERVQHAIYLLQERKVKKILFTGGYGEGESLSDAEVAARYASNAGIHEDQILIEEESTITFFNLLNARSLMVQNGLKNALFVSDPYHMKRSMHMCEKIGIDALPSPTPTTMYRSRKTKFQFLVKEAWNYWGYILVGQHRKTTV